MKWTPILLILIVLAGCSPDNTRHYVEADYDRGMIPNLTGRHLVRTARRVIAIVDTYAEADSLCRELNEERAAVVDTTAVADSSITAEELGWVMDCVENVPLIIFRGVTTCGQCDQIINGWEIVDGDTLHVRLVEVWE